MMRCLRISLVQFLCLLLFFNFDNTIVCSFPPTKSICSPASSASLLQFKNAFSFDSSPCGRQEGSFKTGSWTARTDCCTWDGVTCDSITGHVIGIDLSHSCLYGTFATNSSLFSLLHLQILDLSGNNFVLSEISPKFGHLTSLNHLILSSSNFSGQVPSEISNLNKILLLNLSHNQITGEIPSSFTKLSQLQWLDLSYNRFVGPIPSWVFNAPSLESLDLSRNQLIGHFNELKTTSLVSIRIHSNGLNGSIPSSIFHQLNLTALDLSSNNFSGRVDLQMFSNLQRLKTLDLSRNVITLIFDVSVSYTLSALQFLGLSSDNRIQDIPKWFWDWKEFNSLNISHNYLNEFEPPYELARLDSLDLSFNSIQGPLYIPPPDLSFYSISNNELSGKIPPSICQSGKLGVLDLSHNNLSGVIPPCIQYMFDLRVLNLGSNKFSGMIPTLERYARPYDLDNLLFPNGCLLEYLNLNDNQLEGHIPRTIGNCTDLQLLDLGNNDLNGTFPHWLGSLPDLQVLVLRSNNLHGSLSDSKASGSFSKLRILDVSGNRLSGPITATFIQNLRAMVNVGGNDMHYMNSENDSSVYRIVDPVYVIGNLVYY